MNYEALIAIHKNETDFEKLQNDLNAVEAFLDKCLKFICECSGSVAERDYNVTSL